ncbi:MAG: hypothetical protein J6X43_05105 [Bacteroidales bacterium]|nr:hypothetical protein [Bacteroidales bacterium]
MTCLNNANICAQSFTPAQEIEIVKNPNDATNSPWFIVKNTDTKVVFPQWTFTVHELKRFTN